MNLQPKPSETSLSKTSDGFWIIEYVMDDAEEPVRLQTDGDFYDLQVLEFWEACLTTPEGNILKHKSELLIKNIQTELKLHSHNK